MEELQSLTGLEPFLCLGSQDIYLLWRFPTSSQCLFSDYLWSKNWITILKLKDVVISSRTLEQGLYPSCLLTTLGSWWISEQLYSLFCVLVAPTTSSCPFCTFRNQLQSHLQQTPDPRASPVSALSYAMLFLETRPKEEGSNGKPLTTLEGRSPVLANTYLETILLCFTYWCHSAAPFGKIQTHSWNSLYLLSLKHAIKILGFPFSHIWTVKQLSLPRNKGKHLNLSMKICPEKRRVSPFPPSSPAGLLLLCLSLRWEVDPGQTLYLLPSRWSHPQRSVDPGKETDSGASTGKAADGKVKNIPREREHPYAAG